ncbi:CPBP family intramembrane metalloprotease [Natronomonas salina]|uniref:CPBP family intramembrane glutamic endopeptidase n=1 Tax=Natronomonas salina TaxID=1710540 RepID=UPI0015B51154|nr:CPBP family intramembrane glutamic endopeptidase [Natronomonas salina]QLD90110.1 CPBP family intramembrane metalloprotease [Natronomonas salina]
MTRWGAFAGITLAVLVLLLLLARASQSVVSGRSAYVTREEGRWLDRLPDGAGHLEAADAPSPTRKSPAESTLEPGPDLSTTALLANVAASHGLFALLLLGGIWLTEVPAAALGVTDAPLSTGPLAVAVGLALGAAISLANTLATGLAEALGTEPADELREMLSPETARGWAVLLLGVLPVIAGFEELLFRGALVGGFAAGFGVSPWLLAALSSIAFAAGHGAQGGLGVVVTGLLGFALAAAFVLTESLLVVVVAHYVVNAAEFVVVEGLGWEPFG